MGDRQYGIPPGYREQVPARQPAPISPISIRSQTIPGYGVYRPPSDLMSDAGSPTRHSAQPYATRSGPPSPPRHAGDGASMPNDRFSDGGTQALRDIDHIFGGRMMTPSPELYETPNPAPLRQQRSVPPVMRPRPTYHYTNSQSSITPLVVQPGSPARQTSPIRRNHGFVHPDSPYRDEIALRPSFAYQGDEYDCHVNPNDIVDDGDDGFEEQPERHGGFAPPVGVAGPSAGTGTIMKGFGSRDPSGNYGRVSDRSQNEMDPEKSEWLREQSAGSKRLKWIIGSVLGIIIVAAIVGGAVGGVLASKKSSSGNSVNHSSSSSNDGSGLYDINSSQVKALLNNSALHKVFPGIDYTPMNAQYPACLTVPPDQNNITLDIAMLAQLAPAVRLYGTDCNQTQMVLEAINRLGYNDTMKVWLGVWLENNATTNSRQLRQMYDILDTYPSSQFAGVIVGNEVLFRKDMTEAELGQQLQDVRQNLTSRNIDLPVATSDLGDDWTAGLAADSDIVMANVHPFFAGVTPEVAPGWTWDFWQTNDVVLTGSSKSSSGYPRNIISETGWPSTGGNDCGTDNTCTTSTEGAVASIENMNVYMDGFVCQSMANGTTYFWY